jgi:hypothetical protein
MTEEANDEPVGTQKSEYFRGRVLRFVGMFLISGVITYGVVNPSSSRVGDIIVMLLIGLVGAGTHYAGRKLSPGAHWSSIRGGCLAVLAPLIFGLVFVIIFMGLLSDTGLFDFLGGIIAVFAG